MTGLLSRGNLILGVSWALAVTMFVARGRHVDGGVGSGAAKAPPPPPRAHVSQQEIAAPVAAPVVAPEVAPLEVPVSAEPVEALSRNDQRAPLP